MTKAIYPLHPADDLRSTKFIVLEACDMMFRVRRRLRNRIVQLHEDERKHLEAYMAEIKDVIGRNKARRVLLEEHFRKHPKGQQHE